MTDLSHYEGIGQFGPAYRVMLENDAHAPGSVDRLLMQRMVLLCRETAGYLYGPFTPTHVRYRRGSRPKLEGHLNQSGADLGSAEDVVRVVSRFCAERGRGAGSDLDAMRVGGTEEQIIARGTDWCADVARAACALCQVAGLPARLVYLADTARAYCGHAIIEVFRAGAWGAVDPTTNVVYLHADGRPATTWDLMNHPAMLEAHCRGEATPYTTADQFRSAAISNYFVRDSSSYDYTAGPLNHYCRSVLEMSLRGWPGGLRWLHGEDKP